MTHEKIFGCLALTLLSALSNAAEPALAHQYLPPAHPGQWRGVLGVFAYRHRQLSTADEICPFLRRQVAPIRGRGTGPGLSQRLPHRLRSQDRRRQRAQAHPGAQGQRRAGRHHLGDAPGDQGSDRQSRPHALHLSAALRRAGVHQVPLLARRRRSSATS